MKKHYLLNFKEIGERFFSLYGDLSRSELAEKFDVVPSAVSDWKNNKKKVPWDKLIQAVADKNVKWDWLLAGDADKQREGDMNGIASITVDGGAAQRIHDFFGEVKNDPKWRERCEKLGVSADAINAFQRNSVPQADTLLAVGKLGGDLCLMLTGSPGAPREDGALSLASDPNVRGAIIDCLDALQALVRVLRDLETGSPGKVTAALRETQAPLEAATASIEKLSARRKSRRQES